MLRLWAFLSVTALCGQTSRREVAITIDDLPWAGARTCELTLTEPLTRGETITSELLRARGRRLRYFRHPFLHAGTTIETKRGLEQYLAKRGYQVAPVTLDNSDWMFAFVYKDAFDRGDDALARRVRDAYVPYMESVVAFLEKRSVEVAGREFPQVLLIHANQLNADLLPSLLDMFRKRGYRFITLETALADSVYQLRDDYAGPGGFSWIHRWSKTKGMEPKGEPDEPPFVSDAYRKLSADR